jgi:hypothetical protein
MVFVPTRGPDLLAWGLDGRLRWQFQAAEKVWLDQTPVLWQESLLVSDSSGHVYSLAAADGTLQWRTAVGPAQKRLSPPLVYDDLLFVGAKDGVYALDVENGRVVWHFPTKRQVEGTPVAVGNTLYFTSHDHNLYATAVQDGRERWRFALARRVEVAPVLAVVAATSQGVIVVADRGGVVSALRRRITAVELEALGNLEKAAAAYGAEDKPAAAATLWPAALWSLVLLGPLTVVGWHDVLSKRHSILRNFPLLGHGRFLFESIRPEIQQYFVESNTDQRPIERELRNLVYQRAKGQLETLPFGTQRDVYRIGYEWAGHSIAPLEPPGLGVDGAPIHCDLVPPARVEAGNREGRGLGAGLPG